MDLAQTLCRRWEAMCGERAPWLSVWQDIANYVMPRKSEVTIKTDLPNNGGEMALYDSTAVYANATLANGMLSYMTPAGTPWFAYSPPQSKDNDKARLWFQQATEITQLILANSNFYGEIHEAYFDDGGFGTTTLFVEEGKRQPLNFQALEVGSFCLSEDDESNVDTCFRELRMTCRQAALKFGAENLSPKMQAALAEYEKSGREGPKSSILHAIYPRPAEERDRGKGDGENKAYASVYVDLQDKHTIKEAGFDEQPFFATRHLKHGNSVYGYSPSWMALPDTKQLNFLSKQLDALAELKAFPRILSPETHVGGYDLAPGGVTYFDPNAGGGAKPQEWATSGDYNVGMDREKRRQEAIERAYHVDLFNMFAQLDKQMTAREVSERAAEKLVMFTPAFSRKTTELFNPLLQRVFGILLRGGYFPAPPQDIFVQNPNTGALALPEPKIEYNSRVALAVKAVQNNSFARSLETLQPLLAVKPEVIHNLDCDRILRDSAINDGFPAGWLVSEEDRDKLRAQLAQQAQQQAQMQQALAVSQAARNAGSIRADSPVAQQLKSQQS